MIEGIPGWCPTAPFLESFSEERCQREVVETFDTWSVKTLFLEKIQPILYKVKKHHPAMVRELFRSGRTQKRSISPEHVDVQNQITLKVRFDVRHSVETLIYKPLQCGTYKNVFAVVRCSGQGDSVYAYAKSKTLHKDRETLQYLKGKEACCCSDSAAAELKEDIEIFRARIAFFEKQFQTEARVSSALAPFSVDAQLVYRKDRVTIKGMKMEYAFGGDLSDYLTYEGQKIPVPLLVRTASRVCSLVAKAHQAGFLHGDIKPGNILLRRKPEGSVPLSTLVLCDLSLAIKIPSDEPCVEVTATYPPPEIFLANEQNPMKHGFEEDLWALGITVFSIVYGKKELASCSMYFQRKKIPWSWEEISQEPRYPQNGIYSDVRRVIGDLMQKEPAKRILAKVAAERLEAIASAQMTSTATVS